MRPSRTYTPEVRRPVVDVRACWILVRHPSRGSGTSHVSQCAHPARPKLRTCVWHAKWESLTRSA